MIFNSLDDGGDWNFGRGIATYATLNNAIGLNIKTRLLSWLGDCFFAQAEGIDWKNRLGSKNQRKLLEADLKKVIQQSYGVTGITKIDTMVTDRQFSASYEVNTIYSKSYQDSIKVGVV